MEDIYLLHFDEYGEPYIAHAESTQRKEHKYLKRIDNAYGPGKHLYLYTQREIDAWEKHGKRTLSNRIRDALGFDERDAAIDAEREYRSDHASTGTQGRSYENYQTAKKNYENTFVGKIDNLKVTLQTRISDIVGMSKSSRNVLEENASTPMSEVNAAMDSSETSKKETETKEEAKPKTPNREEIQTVAKDVLIGKYGNGREREQRLKEAGYDYDMIDWFIKNSQNGTMTEEQFKAMPPELTRADTEDKTFKDARAAARGVLRGDYGNGEARKRALEQLGYDPAAIQWIANYLKGGHGYITEEQFKALPKPPEVEKWFEDSGYWK